MFHSYYNLRGRNQRGKAMIFMISPQIHRIFIQIRAHLGLELRCFGQNIYLKQQNILFTARSYNALTAMQRKMQYYVAAFADDLERALASTKA